MEATSMVICFLILVAAFLIWAQRDRTSHALVLQRLDQYMANNLELKRDVAELAKSRDDFRSVVMGYKLEFDKADERLIKIEGSQSRAIKKINEIIKEAQPRTVNVNVIESQQSNSH